MINVFTTNPSPLFQIRLESDNLILGGSKSESIGCILRGQLVLAITEPVKVKTIKLTFQGKSKIILEKGTGMNDLSEERILYQHDWVFLPVQNKYHVLKPDNHYWDFELVLPGTLNETVNTWNESYVHYNLKAVAERSTFFPNLHTERNVRIDRCLMSNFSAPPQSMFLHNSWKDKVEYEISVGSKYVCLGGKIPIEITIRPLMSGFKVFQICCGLKEFVTYNIRSRKTIDERILYLIENRSVPCYEGIWIENKEMSIPKTGWLTDSENDQIQIQHELTFSILLQNEESNEFTKLRSFLPVIICPIGSIDDTKLPSYSDSDKGVTENLLNSIPPLCLDSNSVCESDVVDLNSLPSYDSIASLIPIIDTTLPPSYVL